MSARVRSGDVVRLGKGRTSWLVQSVSDDTAVLYSGRHTRTVPITSLFAIPAKAEPVKPIPPEALARQLGLHLHRLPDLEPVALYVEKHQLVLVSEDLCDREAREAIYSVADDEETTRD